MKWFRKLLPERRANRFSAAVVDDKQPQPAPNTLTTTTKTARGPCNRGRNSSNSMSVRAETTTTTTTTTWTIKRVRQQRRPTTIAPTLQQRSQYPQSTQQRHRSTTSLRLLLAATLDGADRRRANTTAVATIRLVVQPDEFFDDPADVAAHMAEKLFLAEWQIIDEVMIAKMQERDNINNDNDDDEVEDDLDDSTYQTTCFCGADEDADLLGKNADADNTDNTDNTTDRQSTSSDTFDFVQVQRTPSVISLRSYTDDTFGIYPSADFDYATTLPKFPEAAVHCTFGCDILCGVPLRRTAFEDIFVETLNSGGGGGGVAGIGIATCDDSVVKDKTGENPPQKQRCVKHRSPSTTAEMTMHSAVTSDEIARHWRLNDAGSICLDMTHVEEERGFGFLMRRNKQLYRNVPIGEAIDEKVVRRAFRSSGDDDDGGVDDDNGGPVTRMMRCLWQCVSGGAEQRPRDNGRDSTRHRHGQATTAVQNQWDHPRNKLHCLGGLCSESHLHPGNGTGTANNNNGTNTSSHGCGSAIADYAYSLANDPHTTFARNIQNFITCTRESPELKPQVIMRNMRQFMSGMKNYLVKHGEGEFQNEVLRARSRLRADEFLNLDQILEAVMHRLVVLPLRQHLYALSVEHYVQAGQIQLLVDNVRYAAGRTPAEFGIPPTVEPPSPVAMQRIALLLQRLQEAELPLDKLSYLLTVVAAIFETANSTDADQILGADYFLPLLVYVVARCEFIGAEVEAEFMYGLLQQSLLTGEAGYYLTALCSAVEVLKGMMAAADDGQTAAAAAAADRRRRAAGGASTEATEQPATLPAVVACSSVLRVIIPDELNGSLQTCTLPVRPNTTTKEVCRSIAHKARITNPQDYALFELINGEETLMTDAECPQESRLAARGQHCLFAYKRIEAKIAWPTQTSAV